jgi:hypothetical protein
MMLPFGTPFGKRPAALVGALLGSGLASTLWGCLWLYDLLKKNCGSTPDCVALGADFADKVCVQNLCVAVQSQGCTSNAECIDAEGNYGEPSACFDRRCVPLKTASCPVVLPVTRDLWKENLRSNDPLILGAFATIPPELIGMQLRNYDLALTEFTDKVTGLPASGGGRRRLVMVVCKSNFEGRSELDASMAHLADDLKVPGLVSGLLADDLQYAFESKGLSSNMFFMSPLESDSTLALMADDGLVWHVGPGGDYVGRAYAPLLTRTLTYLNVPDTVRVATVVASDLRYLADVASTVQAAPDKGGIRFNGKTAAENLSDANYKPLSIVSSYTDPDAPLSDQIAALLDFKPHVIVAATADEFLDKVVPSVERQWPAGGQAKPFYLLSPYHYNNPELPPLLANLPEVRQRLIGVNGPSAVDQTLYNAYQFAFDLAWPEVAGRRGYENFYDAAYYLIYAAAGAGNLLVNGQDLKRGMTRLLSGTRYDMGPAQMGQALQALQVAGISLQGTLGPPNFDLNSGARQAVGSAWCVDSAGQQRADVMRYDDASGNMVGTMPCFAGF